MITPLQIEPARAKSVNDKKLAAMWGDHEWIAEEKLDGWRYMMHVGSPLDRAYMTGRRISKETGLLSEKGLCVPCLWPDAGSLGMTILDGEVMPPIGAGFRDMASIMNSDPEESARTMDRIGNPRYFAFDILYHDGQDVREQSLLERKKLLSMVVADFAHPLITVVPTLPASLGEYDRIVAQGGEGVILKNIFALYGEAGSWLKVKKFTTLDVVVTGFTDARFGRTGKYDGQIGAVVVGVYGEAGTLLEVGQVSGMSDEIRREMTANPERWIGSVIEVAAQEFGRDRLRHPRYKRERPDANPRSCTLAKMLRELRSGDESEPRVVMGEQLELI